MALSTKVHQKAKMIKSDRWESWGDSCPSNWVGDGACDDECNTEDNSWDGGDCCGPDVDASLCWDCECLDPNSEDFDENDPCFVLYVDDGYCDDELSKFKLIRGRHIQCRMQSSHHLHISHLYQNHGLHCCIHRHSIHHFTKKNKTGNPSSV